jgi:hypothetical protein
MKDDEQDFFGSENFGMDLGAILLEAMFSAIRSKIDLAIKLKNGEKLTAEEINMILKEIDDSFADLKKNLRKEKFTYRLLKFTTSLIKKQDEQAQALYEASKNSLSLVKKQPKLVKDLKIDFNTAKKDPSNENLLLASEQVGLIRKFEGCRIEYISYNIQYYNRYKFVKSDIYETLDDKFNEALEVEQKIISLRRNHK